MNDKKNIDYLGSPTFRLFAMPSVMEGIGSIIDMKGSDFHYNFNRSDEQADFQALLSDWKAIGMDMFAAMQDETERVNCID